MNDRRRGVFSAAAALAALTLVVAHLIQRMRAAPSALPYGQRAWAEFPRPFVTRARLCGMLGLEGDERVLKVGPGPGTFEGCKTELGW